MKILLSLAGRNGLFGESIKKVVVFKKILD